MSVGTDNVSVPFQFVSTDPNIILNNDTDYDGSASNTFVPTSLNTSTTVYDLILAPFPVTGQIAYESFNFSGLTTHGQGFLLSDSNINVSRMGFSFNKSNSLGYPNFIEKLYQEAQIGPKILAFVANLSFDSLPFSGYVDLGYINETQFTGPLTNYSVNIDNGDWAFYLTDMAFGNVALGYNGYVTINTNSPVHVVPMPIFETILSLINKPYLQMPLENLYTVFFSCSQLDLSTMPNFTYYLNHQPLTLTPYQYFIAYPNDQCFLSMAGTNNVAPNKAAFTLGTMLMNTTYTVFDFDQKTFGYAFQAPNAGGIGP